MPDLTGKTVLITGAGRGWGHSIARTFASFGAQVVAASRTGSELADLEQTIQSEGGQVDVHSVDLTDLDANDRLAADVLDRYGTVDILVCAAAILRNTPFMELTDQEWDQTLAVMLSSPARLARAVLPGMIEAGHGAIINISSRAGVQPFELEVDYCAAKYGLEGFSRSLALEVKQHNVSVYTVTPGPSDLPIKPTSVNASDFANWPEGRRAQYRDSMAFSDGIVYLATREGTELSGRRFAAFKLSELIRQHGYDLSQTLAETAQEP